MPVPREIPVHPFGDPWVTLEPPRHGRGVRVVAGDIRTVGQTLPADTQFIIIDSLNRLASPALPPGPVLARPMTIPTHSRWRRAWDRVHGRWIALPWTA